MNNPQDAIAIVAANPNFSTQVIERRKLANGERLYEQTNGIIQHGILKGYRLPKDTTWISTDIASQLLGLYELEVCAPLSHLKLHRPHFIDLGAADGLYGLGLVSLEHFERSWSFEIAEESRQALARRAKQLGVEQKVEIYGDAKVDFPREVRNGNIDLTKSVILSDIEGNEFDLFDDELLQLVRDAYIIIENHDFMRTERYASSKALIARAKKWFHVTKVQVGPRDLRNIPLIADHWGDNDRWLLCSEGRAKLCSWLVLSPREQTILDDATCEKIRADYVRRSWPKPPIDL